MATRLIQTQLLCSAGTSTYAHVRCLGPFEAWLRCLCRPEQGTKPYDYMHARMPAYGDEYARTPAGTCVRTCTNACRYLSIYLSTYSHPVVDTISGCSRIGRSFCKRTDRKGHEARLGADGRLTMHGNLSSSMRPENGRSFKFEYPSKLQNGLF